MPCKLHGIVLAVFVTFTALEVACSSSDTTASNGATSSSGGASSSSGASPGTTSSSGGSQGSSSGDAGPATGGATISLVAGGVMGSVDGLGPSAGISCPSAMAFDGDHSVYVAECNSKIRKVDLTTRDVTTLAVQVRATGLAYDPLYKALYSIDSTEAVLKKTALAAATTEVVAGALNANVSTDGIGTAARFLKPTRMTLSGSKLYISDGCAIRVVDTSTKEVLTLAGDAADCKYAEGSFAAARFGRSGAGPLGLVMGPKDTLFLADRNNYRVRALHLDTKATELVAGSSFGYADGAAGVAKFQEVKDVAYDAARSAVYVAESTGSIRKVALSGAYATNVVTTAVGDGTPGLTFAEGQPGKLVTPQSIVLVGSDLVGVDGAGVVFRVTGL